MHIAEKPRRGLLAFAAYPSRKATPYRGAGVPLATAPLS